MKKKQTALFLFWAKHSSVAHFTWCSFIFDVVVKSLNPALSVWLEDSLHQPFESCCWIHSGHKDYFLQICSVDKWVMQTFRNNLWIYNNFPNSYIFSHMYVLDTDDSPFLCPTVRWFLFSKMGISGFSCFTYPDITACFYLLYLQRIYLTPYSLKSIMSHQKRQRVKETCFACL